MGILRYLRKPSIPSLTGWPEALLPVLRPIKETIEIITGRKGEKLDQLSGDVTVADIAGRVNEIIRVLQDGANDDVLVNGVMAPAASPTPKYVAIVTALPAAGSYIDEVVVLASTKTLYRWTGSAWA